MIESWWIIVIVMGALVLLDMFILGATYLFKLFSLHGYLKREKLGVLVRRSIASGRLEGLARVGRRDQLYYLYEWFRAGQTALIPENLQREIGVLVCRWNVLPRVDSLLKSREFKKRAMGINLLFLLDGDSKREILETILKVEPAVLLKLKIVQILCETDDVGAVDHIWDSMKGAGDNYKNRVLNMLRDNYKLLIGWTDINQTRSDPEALRILIQATRTKLREWYLPFLRRMIFYPDSVVAGEAAEVLMEVYGDGDSLKLLMKSDLPRYRRRAVYQSFYKGPLPGPVDTAELLVQEEFYAPLVAGLSRRIEDVPRLIPEFFHRYKEGRCKEEKRGYAAVLATRVQYFILRLNGEDKEAIRELLGDMIELELSSPLINFLNRNKNKKLEKDLLNVLEPKIKSNGTFLRQCQTFLKGELQAKLNLPPLVEEEGTPKIPLSRKDRFLMVVIIMFVIALPLSLFLGVMGSRLPYMTYEEIFVAFLLTYHHVFAFYTIMLNFFYLFLLAQSWILISKQLSDWNIADRKFLNARGAMPSVSVLAPAYNEETTIVQSVYSLLSLNYPNLEVIIINDGSTDSTVRRLIDQFGLKLVDYPLLKVIPTAPVLGLYQNDHIPNLLVIDKRNGGKADALNVGLNAAKGEYICSIDADSLLEPEALTRLMYRIMNSGRKTVAMGGNIIPVNGCLTNKGSIREIHFASNRYSRYQTIEYLRSFITGRLGWTRLNGLMIISGAFGAFLRRDVMDIGGYMTGTGAMKRDTVGEDMELVVRLIRHLNEKGETFRIDYAYNANCWTEVPENLGDLLKQRDRWHRGLIEILIYHKKMLFNGKYGIPGLLAFPYLFVFELLGPFWEFFGYGALLLSLIFGLMSGQIFLFMFTIIVLLGILISATSLLLAERDVIYFKGKEFFQGLATVVEENFGFRQFMSMYRVFAFISYLFHNKGWQKFNRKGFTLPQDPESLTDES